MKSKTAVFFPYILANILIVAGFWLTGLKSDPGVLVESAGIGEALWDISC
ncbi:MAG TPA: hypothetical protein VFD62_12300 [Pyrinomonadaceae bacterium]|nr:hypothetical protein [Pyrinomonadaceae bacterium]